MQLCKSKTRALFPPPVAKVSPFASGTAAVFSSRSPGKTTENEDAAALIPYDESSGVLVIADGMGGSQAGDRASQLAVEALMESVLKAAADEVPLREGILNGIEHANHAVTELGLGAGTTLAVVELQENVMRPYHVGDSMILAPALVISAGEIEELAGRARIALDRTLAGLPTLTSAAR